MEQLNSHYNTLKHMSFVQTTPTKKFIERVKSLKNEGVINRFNEIAERLNWDKTALSNVMNGRREVPPEVYKLFIEVYGEQKTPEDQGYKDKYIALLEKRVTELEIQQQQITELSGRLDVLKNSIIAVAAFQKGYQEYWAEHYPPKGQTAAQVRKGVRSKSLEALEEFEKTGIRVS